MNAEFLRQVLLFRGLDDGDLAEILMLGVVKEYDQGEVIFDEGDAGDRFFILYEGSVRISKLFQMGEEALTVLGPGEFFGEMSFFDDEPRSARAVAHEKASLMEIENRTLKGHLDERPDVALNFLWAFSRTLSQRVRDTNQKFTALFAISRVF